MRILLDANLSVRVAHELKSHDFDTVHVADVGLLDATDEAIMDWAAANGCVVVTADSDFPMLLALSEASNPSVVLLRDMAEQTADVHIRLLVANLASIETELDEGAVASLSPTRLSIRSLRFDDSAAIRVTVT